MMGPDRFSCGSALPLFLAPYPLTCQCSCLRAPNTTGLNIIPGYAIKPINSFLEARGASMPMPFYKLEELLCYLKSYLPLLEDPSEGVCFDTGLVSHRGPSVLVPTSTPFLSRMLPW